MLIFLTKLVDQLDISLPSWREDTVILLDGAKYHVGSKVREYMRKMKLDVIWSGPYSYDAAPIERLFGQLKLGEINAENQATGKRCKYLVLISDCVAFPHVVNMVGRRLKDIPRSVCVRYWHDSTL